VKVYSKEVAARIEEQSQRLDALAATLKTINGMTQLAQQQMSVLTKHIAELKALPPPTENGGDAE
jgi:maleate cis-trans isomerase